MLNSVYSSLNVSSKSDEQLCQSYVSSLNLGNETLNLLSTGIFPVNVYMIADEFKADDTTRNINGLHYLTPNDLDRSGVHSQDPAQVGKYVLPELTLAKIEDLCAYFDEHPRMVQFIINKHKKLTRALPLTRSFNISDLTRFVLSMSKRINSAVAEITSVKYFTTTYNDSISGYTFPSNIHRPSRKSIAAAVLKNYLLDCVTIGSHMHNRVGNKLIYLLTHKKSVNLKNSAYVTFPSYNTSLVQHGWGSTYAHANIFTNTKKFATPVLLASIIETIFRLALLGAWGTFILPKLLDTINIPTDNNEPIDGKFSLMYTLAISKIINAAKELSLIAKEMYDYFLGDTELAKELNKSNISLETDFSELSPIMSYYLDSGESASSSIINSHIAGNVVHTNTGNLHNLLFIPTSNRGANAGARIESLLKDLYPSISSLGVLISCYALPKNSGYCFFGYNYFAVESKTMKFICNSYTDTRSEHWFDNLNKDIWSLPATYLLSPANMAHLRMLYYWLSTYNAVHVPSMRYQLQLASVSEVCTPPVTKDDQDFATREAPQKDMLGRVRRNIYRGPHTSKYSLPYYVTPCFKMDNVATGTTTLYVRDYKDKKTASNFEEIKIRKT